MSWLDRSDTECQPCDAFRSGDDGYFGAVPHECFAPFDDPTAERCGGKVYYCTNCHSDHHAGGYNTCRGNRGACPHEHPACLALAKDATNG